MTFSLLLIKSTVLQTLLQEEPVTLLKLLLNFSTIKLVAAVDIEKYAFLLKYLHTQRFLETGPRSLKLN